MAEKKAPAKKSDLEQITGILGQFDSETVRTAIENLNLFEKTIETEVVAPLSISAVKLGGSQDAVVLEQLFAIIRTLLWSPGGQPGAAPEEEFWSAVLPCNTTTIHYDPEGPKKCICIRVRKPSNATQNGVAEIKIDGGDEFVGKIHAPGQGTFCGKIIKLHGDTDTIEFRTKSGSCT